MINDKDFGPHSKEEITKAFAAFAEAEVNFSKKYSYKTIPHIAERVMVVINSQGDITRQYFSHALLNSTDPEIRLPSFSVRDPKDEATYHVFAGSSYMQFVRNGSRYLLKGVHHLSESLRPMDGSVFAPEDEFLFPQDPTELGAFQFFFRRGYTYLNTWFDEQGRLRSINFHNGRMNIVGFKGENMGRVLEGGESTITIMHEEDKYSRAYIEEYSLKGIKEEEIVSFRRWEKGNLLDDAVVPIRVDLEMLYANTVDPVIISDPLATHPTEDEEWKQVILEKLIAGFRWNRIPKQMHSSFSQSHI